jgi:hypothetical protein
MKPSRKKFENNNLRCVKTEVCKNFLPRSRRRATVQRLGRNGRVVIIARGRRAGARLF